MRCKCTVVHPDSQNNFNHMQGKDLQKNWHFHQLLLSIKMFN